ncbi:MAG: hypothetical protein ACLFNP_05975 [Spirochaetaceae bacterium]
MKRTLIVAGLLLVVLGGLSAQESALNTVRFTNNTGFEIASLFFSPGDSEFWGPDLLGSEETLRDGEFREFFVHYPEACGSFDFMAVDTDGDAYLIWDYQVCDGRGANVRVTLDDLQGPAPEMSYVELRLVNELPLELFYLFISPGDSEMWGVDYLSRAGVMEKGRLTSFLLPVKGEAVGYDIIAVDEHSDLYTFSIEVDASRWVYEYPIEITDLQEAKP